MNALDSPLEALALNYLSFGFLTSVNSVWTWVAVLTAAVSVWRIRASSPRGRSLDESSLFTCYSTSPSPLVERLTVEPASTSSEPEASGPSTASFSAFEREGRTSGKFIVYYPKDDDSVDGNGRINADDDCDVIDGGNAVGEMSKAVETELLGNGWEVMMKMRMGGMGWYRYQDLTALDGNVVKLWDGCGRKSSIAATSLISCGGGKMQLRGRCINQHLDYSY